MPQYSGIVNIINFIRAVEPRNPALDLYWPVREQMALARKHRLPVTWLLQYDALMDPRFRPILEEGKGERHEIGVWFEIVQPLVESAGLPWRGRFPWDWRAHVGFSVGYTPLERERLADVFMAEFKHAFGRYPASAGCWFFDAHVLSYLADRYGIVAACNCKDQWGTDGYTLWGGYYSQAYYPSRRNAFMPAQFESEQVPVPVFRMLGSDPIYQYDCGAPGRPQGVVTLEPVYGKHGGGGHPAWVRWFFDVTFNAPSLSFAYAQVGQENSFGWPAMASGLTDQMELLARWRDDGRVRVETLADSARWFRSHYRVTPASAVTALSDWRNAGNRSIWYNSRFYRLNLFCHGDIFEVRDIHLFDDSYAERYLTRTCATPNCTYDTLPVADGLLWSSAERRGGVFFYDLLPDGAKRAMTSVPPVVREIGEQELEVVFRSASSAAMTIRLREREVSFHRDGGAWRMEIAWPRTLSSPVTCIEPGRLGFRHEGHDYEVWCAKGEFAPGDDEASVAIRPEEGTVTLLMDVRRGQGERR